VGVEDVGEEVHLQRVAAVVDAAESEIRPGLDIERTDACIDDALRAGNAALVRQAPVAAELLINTRIEFRLVGAAIREGRAERTGPIHRVKGAADRERWISWIGDQRNPAGRSRKRRGVEPA